MAYYYGANDQKTFEKLEFHYYLHGNSHSMDAFLKNKSEAELLKLVKEVSEVLQLDLALEIEAIEPGGLKEFIKFLKRNKKLAKPIGASFAVILTSVLTTVITDHVTSDQEMEELEKKERRLRIRKLEKELESADEEQQKTIINNVTVYVLQDEKVRRYQSNFYKSVELDPKVVRISTTGLDKQNIPVTIEREVKRTEFKKFIIEKIPLESEIIDNAYVQIVAPVLNRRKLNWRGIYNGKSITFKMADPIFKEDVLNKEYRFSNGSEILCNLEFEKELDINGNERVTSRYVTEVLEFYEDGRNSNAPNFRRRNPGESDDLTSN